MTESIGYRSLADISRLLQARELDSATLTELMLQRIEQHNSQLNCYLRVFADEAMQRARQLDCELDRGSWRGPLHGVPIALKDIFDFPGYHASAGSRIARSHGNDHASVLQKLEAAGAIILGTLNLDELAAGGSGDNAHFGRCQNPWNPQHNSGGSSSGSATAVAAGLAYATLGSDAGGSTRIPAAFCGVVGLKPSYGRVSRFGALARTWSMDCIGPLTRSCGDAATVFNAILGQDPLDSSTVASAPVSCTLPAPGNRSLARIGLLDDAATRRHRQVDTNFTRASELLTEAGYALFPRRIADLNRYTEMQQIVVKSEGAAMHERALRDPDSGMSYAVRSVIEGGLEIPAARYIEALSLRARLLQEFVDTVFADVDLLLMPVSLPSAPLFAPSDQLQSAEIDRAFSATATMTRFANYLGLPALSVPSGVDANGLPTAIQLVAQPFQESLLLSTGAHFESHRGALRYPDLN